MSCNCIDKNNGNMTFQTEKKIDMFSLEVVEISPFHFVHRPDCVENYEKCSEEERHLAGVLFGDL